MKWINPITGDEVHPYTSSGNFDYTVCMCYDKCSDCPVQAKKFCYGPHISCEHFVKNHEGELMRTLGYRPADEMPKPAAEKKPFTKEDLKAGMIVVFKNGVPALAVPTQASLSFFGRHHGEDVRELTDLDLMTDDMRSSIHGVNSHAWDVVTVFSPCDRDSRLFDLEARKLLWERKEAPKEPRKVTKADIEKMFGCEVEIVDEEVRK